MDKNSTFVLFCKFVWGLFYNATVAVYSGWVFMTLWLWFAVPFGLQPITNVLLSSGLLLVFAYPLLGGISALAIILQDGKRGELEPPTKLAIEWAKVLLPTFALIAGFIIQYFMHLLF